MLSYMATLFDFKDWLQELDLGPSDYEEISQLVHSLRNICECGLYKTVVARGVNNGWIVSGSGAPDNLKLTTPKQVTAFIRHIEDTLCEGMDAEVFACYKNDMMKDE